MRAKWSAPIRRYWKISEQMMVKYCDLAICDSVNIEKYIHECYDGKGIKGSSPKTTFIAYGADAKHQDKGYTANLVFRLHRSDGSAVEKLHTAWTHKGRKFLYHELKRHGILPMAEQED